MSKIPLFGDEKTIKMALKMANTWEYTKYDPAFCTGSEHSSIFTEEQNSNKVKPKLTAIRLKELPKQDIRVLNCHQDDKFSERGI